MPSIPFQHRFSDSNRQDWDSSEERYNDQPNNETIEFAECYNNEPITSEPRCNGASVEIPVPPPMPATTTNTHVLTRESTMTGSSAASSSSGSISPPTVIGSSSPVAANPGLSRDCYGSASTGSSTCGGVAPIQLTTKSLDIVDIVSVTAKAANGDHKLTRLGTTLPTLSVSEPSPPHDKLECL